MSKEEVKESVISPDDEPDNNVDQSVLKKLDDDVDNIEVPTFETQDPQKFQNVKKLDAIYERHPQAHPKGGYYIEDKEGVIKKAMGVLMKTIGAKLLRLQFTDVLKISRPAMLSFPSSYLHAILRDFQFMPKFLNLAALHASPVERLKFIVSGLVASMHMNVQVCGVRGFLNPILGQTLQAYSPHSHTYFLAQQTSHHPPVSHYTMYGERFELCGYGELIAGLSGLNTLKGQRKGKVTIKIRDPEDLDKFNMYTINEAPIKIEGLLAGDRILSMKGLAVIDHTHNYEAEVLFKPPKKGAIKKLGDFMSGLFSKKKETADPLQALEKKLSDHFLVHIKQRALNSKDTIVIDKGQGSWLENITFKDEEFWNINQVPEDFERVNPEDMPILPSDSNERADLLLMLGNNYPEAQKVKERMENQQRQDKKLRLAQEKLRKAKK